MIVSLTKCLMFQVLLFFIISCKKEFWVPLVQARNPLFYFQSIKIILGPSDAWSMRQSTQQSSDPAYHSEDCWISSLLLLLLLLLLAKEMPSIYFKNGDSLPTARRAAPWWPACAASRQPRPAWAPGWVAADGLSCVGSKVWALRKEEVKGSQL